MIQIRCVHEGRKITKVGRQLFGTKFICVFPQKVYIPSENNIHYVCKLKNQSRPSQYIRSDVYDGVCV